MALTHILCAASRDSGAAGVARKEGAGGGTVGCEQNQGHLDVEEEDEINNNHNNK